VDVTDRRTRTDWAHQIRELMDERYPEAGRIVLVMDNPNTHTSASPDGAFDPTEAKRLAEKLEIRYAPHRRLSTLGSIPAMLSRLSHFLSWRVPDLETLQAQARAWQKRRDAAGA
jgi:hypothetical protein